MQDLEDAIRFLQQGDWQAAHLIVQAQSGPAADWGHAIVHMLEGDVNNADYWYRRARRARPDPFDAEREVAALARDVEAQRGG